MDSGIERRGEEKETPWAQMVYGGSVRGRAWDKHFRSFRGEGEGVEGRASYDGGGWGNEEVPPGGGVVGGHGARRGRCSRGLVMAKIL